MLDGDRDNSMSFLLDGDRDRDNSITFLLDDEIAPSHSISMAIAPSHSISMVEFFARWRSRLLNEFFANRSTSLCSIAIAITPMSVLLDCDRDPTHRDRIFYGAHTPFLAIFLYFYIHTSIVVTIGIISSLFSLSNLNF